MNKINLLTLLISLTFTWSISAQCKYDLDLIDDGIYLEYPIMSITPNTDTAHIEVIEKSIVTMFNSDGDVIYNKMIDKSIEIVLVGLEPGKYFLIVNKTKYEFKKL